MGTCRLCLKSLCGSPVIALESSMRTSINFVLPEINLDISTTPAVCKACCDIIQSLYQFKVNCIEIEEKIRAKTSGGYVKLNLKEIFSNLLTKKKEERLCRTCLCSIDCQSFTVLQPSEPDPYLDSMLIMCLPELDMELCRDPVMCQKCLDSLQKLYNLKTTCLEVEEKLKNYHFAQGTNIDAQINLQEAMESFSNETGLVNIKKEAEIDLVDEKYPDDATQAIKEEEIDIKEDYSAEEIIKDELENEPHKAKNKLDKIMDEVLKNHKEAIHYSCSQCVFTMANKRHYLMHMLIVHTTFNDEKRLMHYCHLCNFQTIYKEQMKKHIIAEHTGKEKLHCPFCPFSSFYSTNLKRHISIHEDMQNLLCFHPLCDFKTSYKYSLQRHEIKMHGNQCSVCSYKNRNKAAIQRHLQSVHGVYEVYQCDMCGFKSFQLAILRKHKIQGHKQTVKNNFTAVKKSNNQLTAEEEEEIKSLLKNEF